MGIEPTQGLLGPALVLKTKRITRPYAPPYFEKHVLNAIKHHLYRTFINFDTLS